MLELSSYMERKMKIKEKIVDTINNTEKIIERDMTDEEIVQYQANQAAKAERQANAQAQAEAKAALLERLGITEEEAKLLLG